MDEKEIIKIKDINGENKEVEVVAYFTLDMNGKDYIIYTENKTDSNGNVEIYTSEVIQKGEKKFELYGITDDEVWAEIKKVMINMAKSGE